MIRLIATDVDGTLIPEGSSNPDPYIEETLLELIDSGINVAIASGRSYESIVGVFPKLRDRAIFISNNGACVTRKDKTIYSNVIDKVLVKDVVRYIRNLPESRILVTTEDESYSETSDKEFVDWIRNGYKINLKLVDDVLKIEKPIVKLAMHLKTIDAAIASKEAVDYFGERIAIMGAGAYWVDFIGKSVDKGNAVIKLQKELGITMEETASFGDNLNDIGLIRSAGYGYAVADAREELKAVAYKVLPKGERAVVEKMKSIV